MGENKTLRFEVLVQKNFEKQFCFPLFLTGNSYHHSLDRIIYADSSFRYNNNLNAEKERGEKRKM